MKNYFGRFVSFALALTLCLAGPVIAGIDCGVQVGCSLEDLGDGQFKLSLTLKNVSTAADAIFKWRLEDPSLSDEWTSVGFEAPPGWDGEFHTGRIDFQIPNGSETTGRIYSSAALVCGGQNALTFAWIFDQADGPAPDCGQLIEDDFTVHTQGLSTTTCENVGGSFICPFVVPTETTTWSAIKARHSD